MPFRSAHRSNHDQQGQSTADLAWSWDPVQRTFSAEPQPAEDGLDGWLAGIHPDDRPGVEAALHRCCEQGASPLACEYRIGRQGAWRWVAGRAQVAARDPAGRALRVVGHQVDVAASRGYRHAFAVFEARYLHLLEHLIAGITVHDPENLAILYANPTACSLLGMERAQLVGSTPSEHRLLRLRQDHSTIPLDETPLMKVCVTGRPITGEVIGVLREGRSEPIWFQVDAHPVHDDEGVLREVLCSFVDVSARIQAEGRSQLLDKRLERVAASAGLGVWDWDLLHDRVFWDAEMHRIYGVPPDRFDGRPQSWSDLVHDEDRAAVLASVADALAGRRPYHVRFRVVRHDGVRTVDAQAVVDRDATGTATRMTGFNHDVTEQVRAERSLDEAQRIFGAFMTHAPILAWFTDEDGRLRFCNRAWAELHHQEPAALIGRTMHELFGPDVSAVYLDNNRAVLDRREILETTEPGPRADGTPGIYLITKFPLPDLEGRRLVGGVGFDITDRQRRDEELLLAKRTAEEAITKDMFLASISHELRTPMNGILGFSEMLLDSSLAPMQQDFARCIYQSAESLLSLINEVLDFNKLASGRFGLVTAPFLLEDLVYDLTDVFRPRLTGSPVELIVDIAADVPQCLIGDRLRIRQVLVNLLGNAVKFTQTGWIELRVDLVGSNRHPPQIMFTVADTGPGIPAEIRERLFQPFTQGAGQAQGGSGLGLAISRRLAELMGGTSEAADRPGGGSIFTVSVPLPAAPPTTPAPPTTTITAGGRPRTVLVVDDHHGSLDVLCRQLQQRGFIVAAARDGGQALVELARSGLRFDVALIDQHMSGINGLELIRFIRGNERLRTLPILMLGDRSGPLGDEGLDVLGIAGFLHKPVRPRLLIEAIMNSADASGRAAAEAIRSLETPVGGIHRPPTMRILVAEDNPIGRKLIQTMLEDLGMHIHLVGDGRSAVDALRTGNFDLALMDCQMPELDGIEATRQHRAQEAPGSRIPIIALTANAFPTDRERCLAAGMDDFLTKPVSRAILAQCLLQWSGRISLSNTPVLDAHRYAEARQLMSAQGGAELAEVFRQTGSADLATAVQSARRGDYRMVERAVHSIKGSCDMSGAVAAGVQARLIIGDLRADRMEGTTAALERLGAELARAVQAMDEHDERAPGS